MLFKTISIDGLNIFCREAGGETAPKLVLLHGFPASSHQYRNLLPALAERFHIVGPDYPGFGNSDMPDPATFAYSFDKTSEVIESLLKKLGFTRFGLYVRDYGGPVGFRIVTRRPDWLEWLIIQNTNAYEVGLASLRCRTVCAAPFGETGRPRPRSRSKLSLSQTPSSSSKCTATRNPSSLARTTGTWTCTSSLGPRRGASSSTSSTTTAPTSGSTRAGTLFSGKDSPKAVIWGQNDIFFTREGGEAYLEDLPRAEMHRLNSGHFAVEDCLPYIVEKMLAFYDKM
jgi:pimeloyl-ACP methyl ester carboxylesterase